MTTIFFQTRYARAVASYVDDNLTNSVASFFLEVTAPAGGTLIKTAQSAGTRVSSQLQVLSSTQPFLISIQPAIKPADKQTLVSQLPVSQSDVLLKSATSQLI